MTYSRDNNTVTLSTTREEWEHVLITLGRAAGVALRHGEHGMFWDLIRLTNAMNNRNSEFRSYDVPKDAPEFAYATEGY